MDDQNIPSAPQKLDYIFFMPVRMKSTSSSLFFKPFIQVVLGQVVLGVAAAAMMPLAASPAMLVNNVSSFPGI